MMSHDVHEDDLSVWLADSCHHHHHLLLLLGRMSCHPLVSGMGMGRVIVWVGSSG